MSSLKSPVVPNPCSQVDIYTDSPQPFDSITVLCHNIGTVVEPVYRVKIRLPDGSELEAEGSPDFVEKQRREFLERRTLSAAQAEAAPSHSQSTSAPVISWETIAETSGRTLQLRSKITGREQEKEACLALLACSEKLLGLAKPTAALLAKWLRASGYPIQRVDRIVQTAVSQGEMLASGSRRARRYELTAPGRLKAFLLAEQLTKLIVGPDGPGHHKNDPAAPKQAIWPE
ncbi:MAG: hypothetical protein HY924_05510 [Elusimicrobia bacterium]|nr:hypothetical protein [Elusimicrobiota bacterium]